MEKVEEYKRMAIQARQSAAAAGNEKVSRQYLQIAEEWEALAKARLSVLTLKGQNSRK